jgi:prepilin-type N-terminal cleavage/methylation domain-containing protein
MLPDGRATPARAGFTLIEVMGALLILSVAMASALRLATSSTSRLNYVDHRAVAVRVAVERGDSLGALPYASLSPRTWADTVTEASEKWLVRCVVSQWSARVRKVEVRADLVGDTVSSGPLVSFLADTW